MKRFAKLYRSDKTKQAYEIHQSLLSSEVPFFRKLSGIIGWLILQVLRPQKQPYNIITYETDWEIGYGESNSSLAVGTWAGLKFANENIRGELARTEKNPETDKDIWVFNAGKSGIYRITNLLVINFSDQTDADNAALATLVTKIAVNWDHLARPLGIGRAMEVSSEATYLTEVFCNGSDTVQLNAGDKVSIFYNLAGSASPNPYVFVVRSYIIIEYLGVQRKKINEEQIHNNFWGLGS